MQMTIKKILNDAKKNSLYKNSFFLTLSRFLNAGVGFIFWIVAAKLYSIEDVGTATNLISSVGIIVSFSKFGFDFSLIRYININDKIKVFGTSFTITTISSFIIGLIYVIGIGYFSDSNIIKNLNFMLIFLIFVVMESIVMITGVALTAIRKADYFFIQNFLLASRVPLLILLVFLGSFGIFASIGLAFLFAALSSILYINRSIGIDFNIDKKFLKESFHFSSGNYLSNVFFTVPVLVIPILVFNLLGDEEAAKYYITFAIGNLVLIIPTTLCTSLFVEGSHGEDLRKNTVRTMLAIFSILIPVVIFIYFYGEYFLGLIGKDYIDAIELLRILAFSSFFVAVSNIFITIHNVKMKVRNNVILGFILFLLLPILSYFFMLKFGIVGVGYAWIITYGIMNFVIVFLITKSGYI